MSSQRFRFSVTRKVAIGLGLIIAIGMISMLMIYRGLEEVERALERLAAVQAPLNAAAYELELNVNGMGLAVLKYLATRTPEYRSWAENDEQDFAHYHAEYLRLAGTEQERDLALRVGRLHSEFASLGHSLMSHADEQERLYATIDEHAEHVDVIIDARLQPGLLGGYAGRPGGFGAAVTTADLEAETAEVVSAVASYHRRPTLEARNTIIARLSVLDRTFASLTGFNLSEEERRHLPELRGAIAGIAELSKEVIALEDAIRIGRQQFIEQRMHIDSLLDDEIQVLALRSMDEPRSAAKIAADRVVIALRYLIPLFLLSSGAIGFLLVRVVRAPLRQLSRGTKAIADGDLNHRVHTPANDEFGDLAEQYNLMAEKLQATTVSRERLELSDSELRWTVTELRDQITARERAERERESLQKELRRSETMAAMGVLVAGVAHEVRNPLFGISSTLDAMSARFPDQPQRRYVDVLRTEVGRLNNLVADLLAYGRPPSHELSVQPLRAAVALAVDACRASARAANVTIVDRLKDETPLVRLNQDRMAQAFKNVIENAIQHAPATTSVRLEGGIVHERGQRWIECSVSDSGPGFDPVDLPRVFEPFFTRRHDGVGLGLALVQRIVDEHGGQVAASNRPEGGAVVKVKLQIANE